MTNLLNILVISETPNNNGGGYDVPEVCKQVRI